MVNEDSKDTLLGLLGNFLNLFLFKLFMSSYYARPQRMLCLPASQTNWFNINWTVFCQGKLSIDSLSDELG